MNQVFFSLPRTLNHLTSLPIDNGATYKVYAQFNKDLEQWELTLVK